MALLLACWVVACHAGPAYPDRADLLPRWRAALADDLRVRALPLAERGEALPPFAPDMAIAVVDQNWRSPDRPPATALLGALRAHVEAGGRLLLFGHAARLVHDLGFESERPETEVYRWGFDRRAVRGSAELNLHVVRGGYENLFHGLAASLTEHTFAIAAGAPAMLPLCTFRFGEPVAGSVVARLGEVLDGVPAPLGPPVLVHWRVGRGEVLACGLVPAVDHEQAGVRDNARRWLRNCARWAQSARGGSLLLLVAAERAASLPEPDRDGPPIVPWLAHWGWQASLFDGDGDEDLRPQEELVRAAVQPSWQAGADVVELTLTDPQHGAPLTWSAKDPIEPPLSWRGQAPGGSWSLGGFRSFAEEAHARGMLVLGGVDPLPVGDRAPERLVALRMLAREFADARRLGAGAFDGFSLRQWWPDPLGYGSAVVQDYQPACALLRIGERTPAFGGALRALDADDGGVRGLPLSGLGAGWRDGFPADLFPVGVLDARARGDRWPGNGVRGGGSYADWLVRQMNTFVRARRLAGGTVLWRRQDPRTLAGRTAAYVHGLSLEPLRAAVAMPLAATGRDGLRATARALVPDVPAQFAAEIDAPAAVHVLQNNWLRLLGSGGGLAFDPGGLARFDTHAIPISDGFLHTRLFGGRPDVAALRRERRDFLADGVRGEGGYGREVRVGHGAFADPRVPSLLACDDTPRWPVRADFEWLPSTGYHELQLRLRPERGASLVAIWLDDVLLRCVALPEVAQSVPVEVPVHVARSGARLLSVEVLAGHAVAIDAMNVRRTADVGVEADVVLPCGSLARLRETSVSSYHEERLTLSTAADVPGFVLHVRCARATRGLQIERRLRLPGYRAVAGGSGDDGYRRPFLLRSDDATRPDLCVVPLHLSRYERFEPAVGELRWRGRVESGLSARVGFLFWPHGRGHEVLPHAARMLATLDRPLQVDLGRDGRASLASDLPLGHSSVLRVETAATTPFLVRERGYWTVRGGQPAPDGGVFVRVFQTPGDVVELVAGAGVLARTRPGRGSQRLVALRDPTPTSATVRVLQPSRLSAPCIEMGADFDAVQVDGQPWAWFDGRTVFLPDRPGEYRVETVAHGGNDPHVRATGAPLVECRFDPVRRELILETGPVSGRPRGLPWTAVLAGPPPVAIDNGERVELSELHLPDVQSEAVAREGGVLIRFRPGKTTVRYRDGTQ